MTFRHCIFDFDGTLVNSLDDVRDSLTLAFERSGVPVHAFDLEIIMQVQLHEAIAATAPDLSAERIEQVIAEFRTIYDASGYPSTTLMAGVAGLLPELERRGVGSYIASNKRHAPTIGILEKFDLGRFFAGVFNPDMYPGEPRMTKGELIAHVMETFSLEKAATMYIGDSEVDVAAARENGIFSVIVESGYGRRVEKFDARPDAVVGEISEILNMG